MRAHLQPLVLPLLDRSEQNSGSSLPDRTSRRVVPAAPPPVSRPPRAHPHLLPSLQLVLVKTSMGGGGEGSVRQSSASHRGTPSFLHSPPIACAIPASRARQPSSSALRSALSAVHEARSASTLTTNAWRRWADAAPCGVCVCGGGNLSCHENAGHKPSPPPTPPPSHLDRNPARQILHRILHRVGSDPWARKTPRPGPSAPTSPPVGDPTACTGADTEDGGERRTAAR